MLTVKLKKMWYALLLILIWPKTLNTKEMTFYVDFERPNLTYYNPKYYGYFNITAQRLNRRDPIHYVNLHSEVLIEFGNDILVEIYLFEFLSNEYRRSFLEVHYKLCEIMQKEKTFLPYIMKFLPYKTCPFPKGEYHLNNIGFPNMPLLRTFPFSKGRLFVNTSNWRTSERVLQCYIDTNIKQRML